jgi:hypothetical protein
LPPPVIGPPALEAAADAGTLEAADVELAADEVVAALATKALPPNNVAAVTPAIKVFFKIIFVSSLSF